MQMARGAAGRPTVTATAHGSQGTVRPGEVVGVAYDDAVPAVNHSTIWSHPGNVFHPGTYVAARLSNDVS